MGLYETKQFCVGADRIRPATRRDHGVPNLNGDGKNYAAGPSDELPNLVDHRDDDEEEDEPPEVTDSSSDEGGADSHADRE